MCVGLCVGRSSNVDAGVGAGESARVAMANAWLFGWKLPYGFLGLGLTMLQHDFLRAFWSEFWI